MNFALLGPIGFGAPLALIALIGVPVVLFLLRAVPPAPTAQIFPPLRLLAGLVTERDAKERTPWFLILLRLAALSLAILAFSRPVMFPEPRNGVDGPLLIVLDDGWSSAPHWRALKSDALRAINRAEREGRSVTLLFTAPALRAAPVKTLPAEEAKAALAALSPKPWRPDRAAAAKRLPGAPEKFGEILWLSDGLSHPPGGESALASVLRSRGPVQLKAPNAPARLLKEVRATAQGLEAKALRAPGGDPFLTLAVDTRDGRSLASKKIAFSGAANEAGALFVLPPEIAARAARVRILGEESAGAVQLIEGRSGRARVGLIDQGGLQPPLLSDQHYVAKAIQPFASVQRGDVGKLIAARSDAIILTDAGALPAPEKRALRAWLDKGGLLIRFAGPRLAAESDDLIPVPLRPGSRALGGALAWENPQPLAPFSPDSPFFGLPTRADVKVRSQVLAQPQSPTGFQTWARLADGTPIVTAAPSGSGMIVLFHLTAGPAWSDLPLSGVFVDMLERTLRFSGRAEAPDPAEAGSGPWVPQRLIDGFGAWRNPGPDDRPLPANSEFQTLAAGPNAPPGLYARGPMGGAVNAAGQDDLLSPLPALAGIAAAPLIGAPGERSLSGALLVLATLLLIADMIWTLRLTGLLTGARRKRTRTRKSGGKAVAKAASLALVFALAGFLIEPGADAQGARAAPAAKALSDPAAAAALQLRLAYVRTGDGKRDAVTEAGLRGLTSELRLRTAIEPEAPLGVNLEKDDLAPFPILYWAAPDAPLALSDKAVEKLDKYMKSGGALVIDTRDGDRAAIQAARGEKSVAARMLAGLNPPPLQPLPKDHVLTKSFYILREFPGRLPSGPIWIESEGASAQRDGVPSLYVGGADWASAWAETPAGDRLYAVTGGERRRELAIRFGVNLVMVTLTGSYKADQVHVPALLERMGQ